VTSPAHITLTQPFATEPTPQQVVGMKALIGKVSPFTIRIGPAITSPNKRLLWFDVNPKSEVLNLREELHAMGIFRTYLPLTKGFLPHMTISEKAREPEEVQSILVSLNLSLPTLDITFDSVAWIIPNEDFVFHEHCKIPLK
jgi:2'-5' RNA ligase